MIAKVESADARSKHAESWKIINQITGSKPVKQAIIQTKSKEDRIKKWYNHFQNSLWTELMVSNELDEITPVMENLKISDTLFK